MARRGGKAASRKAKQRKTQRPNVAARPAAAPPSAVDAALEQTAESAPMQTAAPSARETREAGEARERTRRATRDPRQMVAGPSRLGERAQQEYHYVVRDLRNIGVLVAIMAAILAVAFIAFNVLGIARAG